MVGGFRQWLDYGRGVRKGEHGLMTWIPAGRAGSGVTVTPGGESPAANDQDGKRSAFATAAVFNVSQTESAHTRDRIGRRRVDDPRPDAADVGSV